MKKTQLPFPPHSALGVTVTQLADGSLPWNSWARDELQVEDHYLKPRCNSSDTSMGNTSFVPMLQMGNLKHRGVNNLTRLSVLWLPCAQDHPLEANTLTVHLEWRSLPLVFHSSDRWHCSGLFPCHMALHSFSCLAEVLETPGKRMQEWMASVTLDKSTHARKN